MGEKVNAALEQLVALGKTLDIANLGCSYMQTLEYDNAEWTEETKGEVRANGQGLAGREFEDEGGHLLEGTGFDWNFDVKPLLVGKKCPALPKLRSTNTSEEATVTAIHGEVTVVHIWATWSDDSLTAMAHIHDMLLKHNDWKALRFICISIDDNLEEPARLLAKRGWNRVLSFWAEDNWASECCRILNVSTVPFCFLIDSAETVRLVGVPAALELEANIDSLLKTNRLGELPPAPALPEAGFGFSVAAEELKAFVQKCATELARVRPTLKLTFGYVHVPEAGVQLKSRTLTCDFEYTYSEKGLVAALVHALRTLFDPKLSLKLKCQEVPANYLVVPVDMDTPVQLDALQIDSEGTITAIQKQHPVGEGKLNPDASFSISLQVAGVVSTISGKLSGKGFSGSFMQGPTKGECTITMKVPLWQGYCTHAGKQYAMNAVFDFGEVPFGLGNDSIGTALWVGMRTGENDYSFTKFYCGKYSYNYKGRLEHGSTVFSGTEDSLGLFSFTRCPYILARVRSLFFTS